MRDAFIEILGQPWFAQATAFLGIVIAAVGGFLFKRRLFGIMERIARNIETRERANEKSRSEPVSTNGPAEAPGTVERTAPAAERRPAKAPYPRARVAQRPFDDGAGAGITNRQRLTEGFDILTKLLALYVAGELRERFDGEWWSRGVLGVLHNTRNLPRSGEDEKLIATLDIHCCLTLMDAQWKEWFQRKLGRKPRSWVNELIAARNEWAHKGSLDTADDDAWRVLDTMVRLAERTSPGERADTRTIDRLRALVREASPGTPGAAGRSVPPAEDAGRRRRFGARNSRNDSSTTNCCCYCAKRKRKERMSRRSFRKSCTTALSREARPIECRWPASPCGNCGKSRGAGRRTLSAPPRAEGLRQSK